MTPWYTQLLLALTPVAASAVVAWSLRMLLVTALKRAADRGYDEGWEDRSKDVPAALDPLPEPAPRRSPRAGLVCRICRGTDHVEEDHPAGEYMSWSEAVEAGLNRRSVPGPMARYQANAWARANGHDEPYPDDQAQPDQPRGNLVP